MLAPWGGEKSWLPPLGEVRHDKLAGDMVG